MPCWSLSCKTEHRHHFQSYPFFVCCLAYCIHLFLLAFAKTVNCFCLFKLNDNNLTWNYREKCLTFTSLWLCMYIMVTIITLMIMILLIIIIIMLIMTEDLFFWRLCCSWCSYFICLQLKHCRSRLPLDNVFFSI